MSSSTPSNPAGGSTQRTITNGIGSSVMASAHGPSSSGTGAAGAANNPPASNLNSIVIEYLNKKGYNRTEAMLRAESANQELDPHSAILKEKKKAPEEYVQAFGSLYDWIEGNLDIYKADLRRLLWPVFVYGHLQLVTKGFELDSKPFFEKFRSIFEDEHPDDLRALQSVVFKSHAEENATAKIYLENKYRLSLSVVAYQSMIRMLESTYKDGGETLIGIIQKHIQTVTVDRSADDESAFMQRLNRGKVGENFPAEDEGIPGHNPGSGNTQLDAGFSVLPRIRTGPMPADKEFKEDVQAELEELDAKNPPKPGQESLVQTFDKRIKLEEGEDVPSRTEVPLPPATARDVLMEVQKVKEERSRLKIASRTEGVGPGVSVVMYTFHNTQDSINCIDFSDDKLFVAAGMRESYIRVWSLDGTAIVHSHDPPDRKPSASRRLIGHSGPIFGLSFSPSTHSKNIQGSTTAPKFLVSGSGDRTIRLWSLDTWSCIIVYQGHDLAVWDVSFNPLGGYFVSGSMDKTARMWRTDQPTFLRIFAGHEKDVDVVSWHPNGVYVFTASCDRTVRMWMIGNGSCVRMYTGHTGNITSMAASPDGKLVASADDQGIIILWELATGRLKKRMRGHARGGIWSLSWSAESTIVISAGADGTVRVWDVDLPAEAAGQGKVADTTQQKIDGGAQASGVGGSSKKKGKEVQITPDQVSAFPTKKTPVFRVHFTRQNVAIAAGPYLP